MAFTLSPSSVMRNLSRQDAEREQLKGSKMETYVSLAPEAQSQEAVHSSDMTLPREQQQLSDAGSGFGR
jgi:hypothetical protein